MNIPRAALIIIDVQKGFDDPTLGNRNNQNAEANMAKLLNHWREHTRPVIFIQHISTSADSPFYPGKSGIAFKDEITPQAGELIFKKNVHSAFIGTDLEGTLRRQNIQDVVIVGLTTDHCVSTTTRMASDLGFNTAIVSDATATFDREGPDGRVHAAEEVHQLALVNLHAEFALVLHTETLISYSDKKQNEI